ncbi:MAG: hypothetical protein AAGJ81_13850 [Verrucomicrobiota bacterium]
MFKRIQYAEWQEILPILAFLISFLLFLVIVLRAVRMRKEKAEVMANLPLEEETKITEPKDT